MLSKIMLLVIVTHVSVTPFAQERARTEDARGTLDRGSIYCNSTLGFTIKLPGSWQLQDQDLTRSTKDPNCTGPLCNNPEIGVVLAPKGGITRDRVVFLSAWKLSPEYWDRRHYSLKWFAQIMTTGSLGGSNWIPLAGLTAIQLDSKPAYRLLVGEPGEKGAKGFGYVSETNGYVFLLVGSATSSSEESILQAAVESLEFSKPSR
jgi:hypothetical protein